ncbi:hypothetical protein KR200_007054 [Drosophila serrata]|nr:hypothetical protein KR200_007054 [Drosophila serrata]
MRGNKGRRNHVSRSYHPYRLSPPQGLARIKSDHLIPALQEQNRMQQEQQARLASQSGFGGPAGAGAGSPAVDGALMNMPSYADQMQAAFLDYQRQRAEFEQQQHQLLQKLYHNHPDVSGATPPIQDQLQGLQQQMQQPAKNPQRTNGFHFQRYQYGNNGLQPTGSGRPTARTGSNLVLGAGDFYSTQQHMGFMQQQHQDVLREQQQLVAQQFATSQIAPTTRQTFGMAVPMSSVLSTPSFPTTSDSSHLGFPSGDLSPGF